MIEWNLIACPFDELVSKFKGYVFGFQCVTARGNILSKRLDLGLISTMFLDLLSGSFSKDNGNVKWERESARSAEQPANTDVFPVEVSTGNTCVLARYGWKGLDSTCVSPQDVRPLDVRPEEVKTMDKRPLKVRPMDVRPLDVRPLN